MNGKPLNHELSRLLDRGVAQGIIDEGQRDRLRALALGDSPAQTVTAAPSATSATSVTSAPSATSALSVVTVAYALGALLVLFACGWFLVDRWARLGPWGVLGVALLYGGVLLAAERWLRGRGFTLAADICAALVVSLSPLVAWPFLSLSGRWPDPPRHDPVTGDPLLRDTAWMAWQWLILELVMLLTALATLRRRAMVTVTWPLAGALAGAALHLSIIARSFGGSNASEQWMILAGGFAILLVAERVERWQRGPQRRGAAAVAADGTERRAGPGDYANAFWVIGLAGTTLGYMVLWLRADDSAWRHLLLPTALGLVALSLYVRRRTVLLFGVLGVIGYLGFLAQHVFREFISFPILLAGLGILVILATVWTQTRFPALVDRLEARRGSDERPFPWSGAMAALPIGVALAMSTLSYPDVREEREQEAFRQRLHILRTHSGSLARQASRNIRPPGS